MTEATEPTTEASTTDAPPAPPAPATPAVVDDTDDEDDAPVAYDYDPDTGKAADADHRRRNSAKPGRISPEKAARRALDKERAARRLADKRAREAEQRLAEIERQEQAIEVARAAGLPAVLADRLRGTTAEEMAADAAELAASFGPFGPPTRSPRSALTNPLADESRPEPGAAAVADEILRRRRGW